MIIDQKLLDELSAQAKANPRFRQSYDLRTEASNLSNSSNHSNPSHRDTSQRMLNALLPNTEVPIHKHPNSSENVICLCGCLDEIFFNEDGTQEVKRYHICPSEGSYGCIVPAGVWHTVEVFEPTVIYEAKDGKYGEDGSINLQK